MTNEEGQVAEILFAGRPNTGKTSFLALLYVAIVSDRAEGLKLGNFRDDRTYLNAIGDRLQQCQSATHTPVDQRAELALSLLVGEARLPRMLRIPDTSGETWDSALTERHWPIDLDEQVHRAGTVVLFTHACDDFDSGLTIAAARAADAAVATEEGEPAQPGSSERLPMEHMPTQVELVDLLQLLRPRRRGRSRACLVISAYDLVEPGLSPRGWVEQNCPLLAQYIDVNKDWLDVRIFGISAQGGSFEDTSRVAELQQQDTVTRAFVRDAGGAEVRPEAVLMWALESDD